MDILMRLSEENKLLVEQTIVVLTLLYTSIRLSYYLNHALLKPALGLVPYTISPDNDDLPETLQDDDGTV